MKEILKTLLVLVLLIIAAVVVFTTRGSGNLDFNVKLDSSSSKETFSYDLVSSEYNWVYKNDKSNNMYIMMGKTGEKTYKVYFIHVGAAVFGMDNRYVELRLDDVEFDSNNDIKFNNKNNVALKLHSDDGKTITVSSNLSLGDSQLEGNYNRSTKISHFSMNDFAM